MHVRGDWATTLSAMTWSEADLKEMVVVTR
eukprot:COSAG02_NODE_9287_length_2266_cov_1.170743_4_plen_30_part_00